MNRSDPRKKHRKDLSYIGITNYRGRERYFGVKTVDRRSHSYIIGKTGTGKSTLLRNLILQDINAGAGVGLIDPHGDLSEEILRNIPRERTNHVLYLNPGDQALPVGLNVLDSAGERERSRKAAAVVAAFKSIWRDSWGARLEYLLFQSVSALLEVPGATLLDISKILLDGEYRARALGHVTDPLVSAFFLREYAAWSEALRSVAVAPITNKVGQLLGSSVVRNILCQRKSTFDLRYLMDNQRIFIANLAKGSLGEAPSHLLGALLVSSFYVAAMARVDTPEEKRRDFSLYIDEFQDFTTDALPKIFAEARKYRLSLTVAHQYLRQLPEETRHGILGNVGTIICFRLGSFDSLRMAREFSGMHPKPLTPDDFVNLPRFNIYLKLMIDGETSLPFSARALPPLVEEGSGRRKRVVRQSGSRFGRSRAKVEEEIRRRVEVDNSINKD